MPNVTMPNVTIPITILPAQITNAWARNGRYVDAFFQGRLARAHNYALANMSKVHFQYHVPFSAIPAGTGTGTRERWRFAMHSGTFARYLWGHATIALTRDLIGNAPNPYVKVQIVNNVGTEIGVMKFYYGGVSPNAPADTPNEFGNMILPLTSGGGGPASTLIELTPDTDYFGYVTDEDNARLIALTIWETAKAAKTENGYVGTGYYHGQRVLDTDRQTMTENLRTAWKRNAAPLFHWTVDLQASPRTRASATFANIVDNTSTAVSTSTPGWTLVLDNKSTVRRTTVPTKFWVYAKVSAGSGGTVRIKDSAGATVLDIAVTSSSASWLSGTVNLPASTAKYDVHYACDGINTISLYACSLWQYE